MMTATGNLLTVTPNVALDVTLEVPDFRVGAVHRAVRTQAVAGGKGLNVARVAHTLGCTVETTGFTAGTTGRHVLAALHGLGIGTDFVHVPGETRACYAVLDTVKGSETEIRETGPSVDERDADALVAVLDRRLADTRVDSVVCSGSLPPGAPGDLYARLVDATRRAGSTSILDSSGEAFRLGLRAGPTVVKPNQSEFHDARGREVPPEVVSAEPGGTTDALDRGLDDFRQMCDAWFDHGVELVVVSLGAAGVVAATRNDVLRIWSPRVDTLSSVGCGDALVAGLAVYLPTCHDLADGLRRAVALAAAAARESAPGIVNPGVAQELLPQVYVSIKRGAGTVTACPLPNQQAR